MSADVLEQAFASTATVLAGVEPGDMDRPTPCASWTVHDLVNHVAGGPTYFAVVAETGVAPDGERPDVAAGDYRGAFDEGARRAVAAFRAPDAMDKTMKLPFGELPGGVFVYIASIDTFTHGWDLAKATGQSTDLDPALATQLLGVAQASLPDEFRGPDGQAPFGPKVELSDPACPADELAAFLGRQP
ncbi:MAG TPA: TIGR03086 family metal-binding protein [Acidimicrobiales bacterium]|nr:TIGR03086 family metal-binding protein [Acidimicrobiales bacterium]